MIVIDIRCLHLLSAIGYQEFSTQTDCRGGRLQHFEPHPAFRNSPRRVFFRGGPDVINAWDSLISLFSINQNNRPVVPQLEHPEETEWYNQIEAIHQEIDFNGFSFLMNCLSTI